MDYQLPCTCGEYLTVTEGSAGAQVKCVCGRIMTVPSLGGLRELAGEPAHQPAPEIVVEQMLLAGALPPNRNCVHCGLATANVRRGSVLRPVHLLVVRGDRAALSRQRSS
jgi:hypothetical protein